LLKKLPSEKTITQDEKTGREVWQMTDGGSKSVSCYQEVEAFTDDEQYVVFSSDRTGTFQLYRAELSTGELAQLSEVKDFKSISFGMARNGTEAIYSAGWRVFAVDVETGEDRVLLDFEGKSPSQPSGAPVALSGSGDRVVVAYSPDDTCTTLAIGMLETGAFEEVCRWEGKLSHAQICPGDANLISFDPGPDTQNDMTLPQEERARTWVCDAKTGGTRPFLTMPKGFRATHEYWDRDGERMYFHKKSVPNWIPTTISSIARDGGDWQDHYESTDRKLGHSSIDRTSSFIISDVQSSDENEIYRIDIATCEADLLCWPNTSPIQDQTIHVHPSISAGGNYVDFTSDRRGSSDLYIYPLNQSQNR
jgi:oligogalacturonide lyase